MYRLLNRLWGGYGSGRDCSLYYYVVLSLVPYSVPRTPLCSDKVRSWRINDDLKSWNVPGVKKLCIIEDK